MSSEVRFAILNLGMVLRTLVAGTLCIVAADRLALGQTSGNIQEWYRITLETPKSVAPLTSEVLTRGEEAANALLHANAGFDADAHKTLGWIAMQRRSNTVAEQQLVKALELRSNDGEISYWLATVLHKQDKRALALYHFARAATYDGPGALGSVARDRLNDFLIKSYTKYHGEDAKGLKALKALAGSRPFPPPGFDITPAAQNPE
jgi:hypothetical protein